MLIFKHLEFIDGYVYIGDSQSYFRPICMYLVLYNYFLNKYSEKEIKRILRKSSIEDCNVWLKKIIKENHDKMDCKIISKFLEYIALMGFGEIELKYIFKNNILFSQKRFFASKVFNKIYKRFPEVLVEEILAAYLENFLGLYFKKSVEVKIVEKNGEIFYEASIFKKEFKFSNKFKYPKKIKSEYVSNTLKNIVFRKLISKNKGVIRVTSIYKICVPYLFYFTLLKEIENEEFMRFLSDLGVANGKCKYNWLKQTKNYDFNKWISSICELFEIRGFGKLNYNPNENCFTFLNNFEYYNQFFEKKVVDLLKNRMVLEIKSLYDYSIKCETEMILEGNNFFLKKTDKNIVLTKSQNDIYNKSNVKILLDKF